MPTRIGIDLGTSNIRVAVKDKGIVMRLPTVIVLRQYTDEIIAYGRAAREMLGKTPGSVRAVRPLRNGVIADGDVTAQLLSRLFRTLGVTSMFSRPSVLVTVPTGITAVERRAVEDAALDAGAKSVTLLDSSVASAIGAGMAVGGTRGCMIVNSGGGTTDASVLSLGGVVSATGVRTAGEVFDRAIVSYLRSHRNVLIGEGAAELVKLNIGSVTPGLRRDKAEVCGRNLLAGHAATVSVSSDEIAEALKDPMETLLSSVKKALEETPPELSADVMGSGLVLTGGTANLPGFADVLSHRLGVRVVKAQKPLDAAAIGLCRIIERPDVFEKLLRTAF